MKLLSYFYIIFWLTNSSKFSVYFILASHLSLDQLHSKYSLPSRGYRIGQRRMECHHLSSIFAWLAPSHSGLYPEMSFLATLSKPATFHS